MSCFTDPVGVIVIVKEGRQVGRSLSDYCEWKQR